METNEIASRLRTFIRDRFEIPEGDVQFTDDVDLFNYGYIDSFGAVDLHAFIENEFSLRLTAPDLVTFPLNTIREISAFLARREKGEL
jgi:methoxymalonate biosynthesis acyl carrier protein